VGGGEGESPEDAFITSKIGKEKKTSKREGKEKKFVVKRGVAKNLL